MLKKRELIGQESQILFDLMVHPEVFPFVRHKAYSHDEFLFLTKQIIEAEEQGKLISRTITDEWENPIGTINLYDIEDNAGFLGTWIGKPYHGKGYNQLAKEAFFNEVFYELGIETIFMRIRKENIRSRKAAEKLPYTIKANETRKSVFEQLNSTGYIYDLYEISKDLFSLHMMRNSSIKEDTQALEA
ncbi:MULTISPECIES: GNAT family N-acetyltransferase [Heyndrickxia]|uniref:GNAT family N-acetyltransferase n=1 Tax=Heyndrickxia TaxID=2837504 RepID=UPI001B037114|nr:GNAT family N-acetyltransferase [Heyndrickxia oleronia]GIN40403.1 alanine acetyltransferase [Heyndrickxia oleronia]